MSDIKKDILFLSKDTCHVDGVGYDVFVKEVDRDFDLRGSNNKNVGRKAKVMNKDSSSDDRLFGDGSPVIQKEVGQYLVVQFVINDSNHQPVGIGSHARTIYAFECGDINGNKVDNSGRNGYNEKAIVVQKANSSTTILDWRMIGQLKF